MKTTFRNINLCLIITLFSVFASCGSDSPVPQPEDVDQVYINLSVAALGNASPVSRAIDGFEPANGDNELIHSLRIYIVRPDGTLEAKRYVLLNGYSVPIYDDLDFKVIANEKKTIYIFANSESLSEYNVGVLKNIDENRELGSMFPIETIKELTIERNTQEISTQPLFNTNQDIPMCEVFDVEVGRYDYQRINTFVTRAATKFTFTMQSAEGYHVYDTDLSVDIAITGISTNEYLLPRNTTYYPDKYAYARDNEREITSYEMPADSKPVTFYLYNAGSFSYEDLNQSGTELFRTDPIYLTESAYVPAGASEQEYKVMIRYNGKGAAYSGEWFEAKLPNLPSLPRNTHVYVNFTVSPYGEIDCTVRLAPYGIINLEPVFGLGSNTFKN